MHAVLMLWRNRVQAVRIALVPWLISMVLFGLFNLRFTGRFAFSDKVFESQEILEQDSYFSYFFLQTLAIALVLTWVVVAWHRFVLLEARTDGALPKMNMRLLLTYVWVSFRVWLVLLIPISIVVVGLAQFYPQFFQEPETPNGFNDIISSMFISLVLSMAFFRLALALPACAVGNPITLKDAWQKTKGRTPAIFLISLILAGIGEVALNLDAVPTDSMIVDIGTAFLSALVALVGVSVLTTMYGVWVEDREL